MKQPFRWLKPALIFAMVCVPAASVLTRPADSASGLRVTVISSRPELVTGDSALVRIERPANSGSSVRVALNGKDVTSVFAPDRDIPAVVGLVQGLRRGENALRATLTGSKDAT